ncbi:MAG: hypothetical protein QXZ30_02435 [Candidatus Bilamarchaeaceae archaeon]
MKIKIITNPLKSWAAKLAKEVEALLTKNGYPIVKKNADTTICIGGDGTILYANYSGNLEGNILGIGSERSYICQLHIKNWKDKLLSILKTKTDDIFVLQYEIKNGIKTIKKGTAINDAVVHSDNYRVIQLSVSINNKKNDFRADGVIVSSAVGTTGYAYSAGGKKLSPTSKKMEVVPIAPYRRMFKPQLIDPKSIVKISAERDCAFIVDGIYVKKLKPDEVVIIKQNGALKFFKGVGWYEQG